MYKPNTDKSMNLNAFNLGVPSLRIPPTLLLMMRLTILMLCAGILQVSARTYGQKITLTQRNAPLVAVLKELRKQSGYDFLYSDKIMEQAKPVSLDVKNAGLEEVLERCFENQPLSYNIENKIVTIKAKTPSFLEKLAAAWRNADVHCRVEDEKGEPLAGASVRVKGTNKAVVTDDKGEFTIKQLEENTVLVISYLGYKTKEILAKEVSGSSAIQLEPAAGELKEVGIISTGYQNLNKERATGSFVQVDNQLLNRDLGSNVLARLDGITSGVIFNKAANRVGNDPTISIRGRSTIFANTNPLIVLDNFPYEGDVNNINPSDIESVTILKDAAAASIWGVRAGNGVIVLSSKKGKYNSAPSVAFRSVYSINEKENLFAVPQLSSAQFIEVQRFFFEKGYYDRELSAFPYNPQSQAVDLLEQQRKGLISMAELNNRLEALGKIDTRTDYIKYFLRPAQLQQYALSISGGGPHNQYYFSAGYDQNLGSKVSDDNNRLTVNARNTYNLFKDRLELSTGLLFVKTRSRSNANSYGIEYPYEQLTDASGNALAVTRDYSQPAKDAYLGKGLLDWNYYPLNERFNQGNVNKNTEYTLNLGLNYKILPKLLDIQATYQYQQGNSEGVSTNALNDYSTRKQINGFSQIDPVTGVVYRPLPLGDIVSTNTGTYSVQNGRLQLNYHQVFGTAHEITALAGTEIRDYNTFASSGGFYGYNGSTATDQQVDYFKYYPLLIEGYNSIIDRLGGSQSGTTDRYISYYANAAYIYQSKYILSASIRKDESNLFGVNANQKGVPLYSMGLAWELNKEKFYHLAALPNLKLRLTYGYNGNLDKRLSAYVTSSQEIYPNQFSELYQKIENPPNPNLSWEKIRNINVAVDFALKNQVLSGSIEFYSKKGTNLIGDSPMAQQSGITTFRGNTADVLTKGLELTLNSINLKGSVSWRTNFLFNYVKDKITGYKIQGAINDYYVGNDIPIIGKPYAALFAYRWAGLDNQGNPQGYLDGHVSKDYKAMELTARADQLVYKGSASPTIFGSLRNDFFYKGFGFSVNVIYKMGYYFRRPSYVSRSPVYASTTDYEKRWQKPGDENYTNVPSVIYPSDGLRSSFFERSEVLVEKGDHIRLHDLQFNYTFSHIAKSILNHFKLSFTASNLGAILWRANKLGLDPDNVGKNRFYAPVPRVYAIGATVTL
ncbi:SusC/RagA family TonB-linked outer membrane protein [Pedobacter nutrimenti]|uniref:TonB-linked SusC/RagA family outer membrane protein n=1 Tax=Pedobacter nutrimenti TaxID=1241337 RepID=A0A318UTX9_9SPHI|nr:SusC/RagA family TonB-linked outer membrane protein [Pedobacter nutrimenti]PYF75099.1 TonB-linked SusC/RagA family outer membrane protein [Pedobacter nutrimenti]